MAGLHTVSLCTLCSKITAACILRFTGAFTLHAMPPDAHRQSHARLGVPSRASSMLKSRMGLLCRLYVIHRCKKLKQLDFRKVKQKEREEAAQVIGSAQQPVDSAAQDKPTTFDPDEELAQAEAATAAAQQQVSLLIITCDLHSHPSRHTQYGQQLVCWTMSLCEFARTYLHMRMCMHGTRIICVKNCHGPAL